MLNPRAWKWVAPETKERVIDVILLFEKLAVLPLEWLTLVIFLAKPEGGHRPIGLGASVVCLWGKIRRE